MMETTNALILYSIFDKTVNLYELSKRCLNSLSSLEKKQFLKV